MLTFNRMRQDAAEKVVAAMRRDGLVREGGETIVANRIVAAITEDSQLRGLIHFGEEIARTGKDPCPDCTPDRLCFPHRVEDLIAP